METRANYLGIGLFTLAALAAAVGFVFWFSNGGVTTSRQSYEIAFDGPVSGLRPGSNVTFNGIRVGEVAGLRIDPKNPSRVIATIAVDPQAPVRTDTRASIESQGLTGIAAIQLRGGAADAPALAATPGAPPMIAADGAAAADLATAARNIAAQVERLTTRLDRVIAENEVALRQTIENTRRFSEALAANADGVRDTLGNISTAAERVARMSETLEKTVTEVDKVVRAIEPDRVRHIIESVDSFTGALAGTSQQVTAFARDLQEAANRVNEITERVSSTVDRVDQVVAAVDPAVVQRAVSNVDRFADSLGASAGNVRTMAVDAEALVKRLNDVAGRVDETLARADKVVAAVDPARVQRTVENIERLSGAIEAERVTRTVESIEKLFAAIDAAKVDRAISNIDRFADALGASSGNVRTLAQDAEALVKRLNEIAGRADTVVAAVDPARVQRTVENIERLSGALDATRINRAVEGIDKLVGAIDATKIDRAIGNVDRFAAALGDSSQRVTQMLTDASELARKLNASADKIDGVLDGLSGFLGGGSGPGGGGGMFAEVAEAARTVRRLADNLDRRTAEISQGLTRFSGQGLREFEALATEGRRTLTEIERVFRNFERNPQRFIFGGSGGVPEFRR